MNRVKMNAKHEYEYLANFKVLQNVFKAKRIEKVPHISTPSEPPTHTDPPPNPFFSRSPSL